MRGVLVTGTDTGVGKTQVAAALAAALAQRGIPVRAAKPFATGEPAPGSDAALLARAAGHPPLVFACLPTAASPARAARQAGVRLDRDAALAWLRGLGEPLIVEGVGGWEVPLAPGWRVAHLAQSLGLPVLVVAANRLGVLNHTLLTVGAVRAAAGLELCGVVLNHGLQGAAEEPLRSWNLEDLRGEGLEAAAMGATEEAGLAEVGEQLLAALPGLEGRLVG